MGWLARSWPWLVLFAAAAVLGLASGAGPTPDSPLPSVHNPGPRGAKVLYTWLREHGARVETLDAPLIPAGVEVLVIAAPQARRITEEEVNALTRFVEAGGTLFYLSPRPASAQPSLKRWLGLADTDAVAAQIKDTVAGDVGGATVASSSRLRGVKQLRVSADSALEVEAAEAIAGKALWVRSLGKGEVWISAGADLLENRRLDLLDNAQLWANFASKRIAFDELHLTSVEAPRWSANLWATLLQFIFVALLFVAARAPRLGPARPALRREHRSTHEYLASMGALIRRANVEGELKLRLRARLRRLMQERLGIAITLTPDEASRQLAGHTGLAADAFAKLDALLTTASGDFVGAAAEAARLEDVVVGRSG